MTSPESLPKTELHLHLDCSLSFSAVKQIDPAITHELFREQFTAGSCCTDLKDYLRKAENLVALLQSEESLQIAVYDLFEQLKKDNVIYAEIRFAPLLHTRKGLTPHRVVSVVNEAVEQSVRHTGIEARIILCTLRHFSEAESLQTVYLADAFKGSYVTGFDIAGDETGFPVDAHVRAFLFAREKHIHCTAHCGEAAGPSSVWETLHHFRPARLGHGVRSIEDSFLVRHITEHNLHLEICPTSNLITKVAESYPKHPVNELYRKGVSLSISTDGRTVSDISLNGEYQKLCESFQWQKQHFFTCNAEAVKHAFCEPQLKRTLMHKLAEAYGFPPVEME
ncbi:MAG: adenosine deaminase [Chitinophagaceae bacterium]|nr:adenosine deaminase [Chitinophagaceae bacterium]